MMKQWKKILSGFLAAALMLAMMTFGTVSAGAASENELELISVSASEIIDNGHWFTEMGNDLYVIIGDDRREIIRLDDAVVDKWSSTGKLTPVKIALDNKLSGKNFKFFTGQSFSDSTNAQFYVDENDVRTRYVEKYDSKNNKLSTVYTTTNYMGLTSDGYITEFDYNKSTNKLTIYFRDPDGNQIKKKTVDISGSYTSDWYAPNGGKYSLLFVFYYGEDENGNFREGGYIKLFDKNGKEKTVVIRNENRDYPGGTDLLSSAALHDNYISYWGSPISTFIVQDIATGTEYMLREDKMLEIEKKAFGENDDRQWTLYNLGNELYDTKLIFTYYSESTSEYKYLLIDLEKKELVGKAYKSISSHDGGNTFLISDGSSWGYMDKNGKIKGMFDDATSFTEGNKYAAVIENGKLYYIDKNYKKVSNPLNIGEDKSIIALEGDLMFYFDKETQIAYLVSYKENGIKTSDSEAPKATTLKASKQGNKITLSWNKVNSIDKYQIYYSEDGGKTYKGLCNVSSSKTSVSTSKFKTGKTYKFKIRSYKTENGKKVYSNFSKTVTIKL